MDIPSAPYSDGIEENIYADKPVANGLHAWVTSTVPRGGRIIIGKYDAHAVIDRQWDYEELNVALAAFLTYDGTTDPVDGKRHSYD